MMRAESIQSVERLAETHLFCRLDEADYVAVLIAAVAVECAGLRVDHERRFVVLMEWAEAN